MRHAKTGKNCKIADDVRLGLKYKDGCHQAVIGDNAVIREGTIIYGDVTMGTDFKCGHAVLIREETSIGNDVLVGTHTVIDGHCTIGSKVRLQTGVYLSTNTIIGDNVFIGPCTALLNDKYPVKKNYELKGPTIEDDVSIGGNATVLPSVRIGKGAFIAAGAVVTKDVPAGKLARGNPARHYDLPEQLRGRNKI